MPSIWPITLPTSVLNGVIERTQDATTRTQMEYGPPKVRKKFTNPVKVFENCKLILNADELEDFVDFFEGTLDNGTETFEWTHPRTGATVEFRILPTPLLSHLATEYWEVSFSMEMLP